MFLKLTWIEIQKIAAKPRSYIGMIVITVIVLVILLAMKADGTSYIKFVTQSVEQSFLVEGKILNGYLVCFIILQTLIIQIPLLVALITGDAISGEAGAGTLRFLLTKPVSRGSVIMSKYCAGSLYTLGLVIWLGILALGGGLLLFGPGDLVVIKSEEIIILQSSDVFWRFMLAIALAFLALSLVGALSMLLSCFTDNSIGPIIITMAIIILFTIIGTLDVPIFDHIKPFLFTTHMIVWRSLFERPLPMHDIMCSIWILLGHTIVFLAIALLYFRKKDILS